MKPSKELESPFLVKQRPVELSYSSTLDNLYHFTITPLDSSESVQEVWVSSEVPFVIKLKLADIQEAVKEEGKLDSNCLNLAIRNMATEDVENCKNKKCLGWRHYVDSDWTESVARGLDNRDTTYLKTVFCRQSTLYNASDSHPNDCGFFMFNFMRLWDGHQLVQSFPTESRELRKDFVAYVLSCKDNKAKLPARVSRWITNLSEEAKSARKDRQSWARYPMDKRLLKAVREGDVEAFERIVGYVEAQEPGAGITSSHDDATAAKQVDEVGGQGAALGGGPAVDERAIGINIPPSAIAGTDAAPGMNRRAETNSIPRHMLLQGASSDGDGVLHIAASHGHVALTRAVLRALRPDPNVVAAAESSPVSGAASTVASLPMPSSADDATNAVRFSEFLRARNHKGETCLHEAVRCGRKGLVAFLVLADAILDDDKTSPALVQIADDEGVSPLYLASTLRRADIVGVLTDKQYCRYSPSYSGPGGKTALHAAVLSNNELTVQLLDWNKDLIYIADESGSTPLHFVASAGHEIIARLLLKKDSDGAYCPDAKGSLPIHVAGAEGRLDMIKQLLQACPDCIWSLDASGQSFLHVAVQKGQVEVVAYVCKEQRFARFFNIRDQEGNTALHLAVRNGNQSVFCSLIRKNEVHLSLINKEGHTPLDLAVLSLDQGNTSGLRYLQAPREWILYGLILAGADFGTCRWDHFTSKITEPDKEKHSEAISKSAGLGSVCAVLILTVAVAAPFNVAKFYLDSSGGASHQASSRSKKSRAFRAFIFFDALAFVYSASATFWCTFAGFPIVDRWRARFIYLKIAWACLRFAAVSMFAVFMLGVYVLVAPGDVMLAIIVCVFALLVIIPHVTEVAMMLIHSAALCQRLGFLPWWRAVNQKGNRRRRNRLPYEYPHLDLGSLSAAISIFLLFGCVAMLTE